MKLSNFDMTEMLFHAQSVERLLPPELAVRLTILLELGCLIFLVLGAGTRITAIILIGLSTMVDPSYQQSIDLALLFDGVGAHCSARTRRVVD